jgi:hypothetical protein
MQQVSRKAMDSPFALSLVLCHPAVAFLHGRFHSGGLCPNCAHAAAIGNSAPFDEICSQTRVRCHRFQDLVCCRMSIRHVGTGNYRDFRSRMIIQFDAKIAFRQSESSPSAGKRVTPIIVIVANPYYLPCPWISCHNLVVPDNHQQKVDCI